MPSSKVPLSFTAPRPRSPTPTAIRWWSTTRGSPPLRRAWRARSPARTRWTPTPRRGWRRRILPSCSTSGQAPSSSAATATAPACITRLTISTTRRSRSGRRTGSGSRKARWLNSRHSAGPVPLRLRVRGVDRGCGAAGRHRTSPGPADGSHLAAADTAAKELIAAIGLETRYAYSLWHFERLQNLSGLRVDVPQVAFVAFKSGVPELAIDPSDSRDEAVGFDGAKNRPGGRIELMDFSVPILPHPQRPFSPRKPRAAAPGRGNRAEHAAGVRINFLDTVARKLEQVMTVKSRSGMRRDIDRADRLPGLGIECVELVFRRKPDVSTVVGGPIHLFDAGKGAIFANDFGC